MTTTITKASLLPVRNRWLSSPFAKEAPSALVAFAIDSQGNLDPRTWYAVVEDHLSVYRLVGPEGQVFMALGMNCQRNPQEFLGCHKIDMVLCSIPSGANQEKESGKDRFVRDYVVPMLERILGK